MLMNIENEYNALVTSSDVSKILKELGINIDNADLKPNRATYIDKTTRRVLCRFYHIDEAKCRENLEKQDNFITNYLTVREIIDEHAPNKYVSRKSTISDVSCSSPNVLKYGNYTFIVNYQ